jgi:hypothetical protein
MGNLSFSAYSKIRQQVVSVTSTPTKIPAVPLNGRKSVVVQNLSTTAIYLGSASVTTTGDSRGLVLASQYASLSIDLSDDLELYGISATPSDVAVLEFV